MHGDAGGLRPLFLGEDRRLTRAAVVAAGVLFFIGMVVDYIALAPHIGERSLLFSYLRGVFRLEDPFAGPMVPSTWVYGYLLVGGLAAVHAYFNLGYLPSLLLALSPNIGTALWSIYSPVEQYMVLSPMLIPERVLPEGPIVATLGFLIGWALRSIHQPPPAPDSPPPDIPDR